MLRSTAPSRSDIRPATWLLSASLLSVPLSTATASVVRRPLTLAVT
jgi:hypothetical protein